jgi:hypothetical protein
MRLEIAGAIDHVLAQLRLIEFRLQFPARIVVAG